MSHAFFAAEQFSKDYVKYRPKPPQQLIDAIIKHIGQHLKPGESGKWKLAVDVGCGCGECTELLQPYFDEVLGTDVSPTQIDEANKIKPDNVSYKVAPAECLPLPDASCSLITACQSAQWFDTNKFFKEVDRILVDNGVLAIISYWMPTLHATDQKVKDERTLEGLILEFCKRPALSTYWNVKQREMVQYGYPDLVSPYGEFVRQDEFFAELQLSCEDLCGYITSWSDFNKCKEQNPELAENELAQFVKDFEEQTYGNLSSKVIAKYKFSLLLVRKGSKK